MYGYPIMAGAIRRDASLIRRDLSGDLRVVCPDGRVEIVSAHRLDIAQALAYDLIPPHCDPDRPTRRKPAPRTKATTSGGFTRQQVDTLGAALKPLIRKIHDRLEALEHRPARKTTSKAPDRPTTRRTALARAGDAMDRAEAVLRR